MGSPPCGGGAVSSGKSDRAAPKTDVVDTAASPGEVADAATSQEHNLSRSFHDTASKAAAGVRFLNGSEKCSGDTFTRPSSPSVSIKHGSLLDAESDIENKKSKVCTFYAKGWCIKGNTCTFLHHKSCDDVDEMNKTHSGEMDRKVEIHEVAGSSKGVISPALGTVDSSASKLDPCLTRLLVQEYGGGISDNQYKSFPRRDLVHNPGILGSDWSSSQSVGDLRHFFLRQGEHNNSFIPSAHGEYADISYSTKIDFDKGDYRQDVLLKQGSSLCESKIFDGRCTEDELHISYDQSSIVRANLGYHVKMPFHGHSTDRKSALFITKQLVNSRSVGEKDYPFWRPYSATQNVSPLPSSHAHGPPFSLGLTTQSLPTDWTPSVPFRSSICPISLKPSIGNQYDPFCDSLVSFDGGNRKTAAAASSQDAKTEDLAHQVMNVVHEDSEKDKLKKDEQVAVKDAIEDKVLGCKHHKKSVSKKERRLFDQDKKSSNGSHNLELHTTGSCRQKDSKSLKLFTIALVDYVKQLMKPSWREGHLSKDAHKAIVKKSVDKVLNFLQHQQVPLTKESTDEYLSLARPKLAKLIEDEARRAAAWILSAVTLVRT